MQGTHSEDARKLVHMAMGGCALLLAYLTWWQAALLAVAALAFNLTLLPRYGQRLYRPEERHFPAGIIFYPVSVLFLILLFPYRLDIAAAAWGILAFGDGMATLVGKRLGTTRVPWNREKSIAGSLALFAFGSIAGAFLAWWCRPAVTPQISLWFSLGAPIVAALVAAFVETIPVRLDDNVSVPAVSAATLWTLSLVSGDIMRNASGIAPLPIVAAVAVNAIASWGGYRLRTVTSSGAICGAVIGTIVAIATGWQGWTLLFLTFLSAAVSSRLGLQRKMLLGIAEERGGRRGAGNAIANTGIAAVAALMSVLTHASDPALVAFTAALAAGGSDTVASEIGKAWGKRTHLVTTLRAVQPGTPGAMSVEGTVAGLAAACTLSSVAILVGLIPHAALLPAVIGATAGSIGESLLGATFEARGVVNNDVLNFLNTAIAAATSVLIWRAIA